MTSALLPKTRDEHLFSPGRKRVLSLDGGGVRGILTCGVLEQMEATLRARLPEDKQAGFRLSDYFDLIAGTSTGAIIATLLSLGYSVAEIKRLYRTLAKDVFGRSNFGAGWRSKFDSKKLTKVIKQCFEDYKTTEGIPEDYVLRLGTKYLKTGLMICSKRIDSGSPWILTNNPKSKFWDNKSPDWEGYYAAGLGERFEFYPNELYELATVVQASASAPFFLNPIEKQISQNEVGLFFDGGVSPHNNPALQAFQMTTAKWQTPPWPEAPRSPWGFGWDTGPDNIMVISLGTGAYRPRFKVSDFRGKWAGMKALEALRSMIPDTSTVGLTWLQSMSRPPFPYYINSEIDDMNGLAVTPDPMLHFQRIDVNLNEGDLRNLLGDDDFNRMLADFPNEGVEGLISDLRELANSADTNMTRLEHIGNMLGQYSFGQDRFGRMPKTADGASDVNPGELIFPRTFDNN